MISDTRTADALPLLSFTLRELYEGFGQDKRLTLEEYRDQLGRLDGCIERTAETVLKAKPLSEVELSDLQTALLSMVRAVDREHYGKQPIWWNDLPISTHDVLERFVDARLLILGGGGKGRTLEIAHEALLRAWQRFKNWIDYNGSDLRLIEYEEMGAARWHETGGTFRELWPRERVERVQHTLAKFKKVPSDQLQALLQPRDLLLKGLTDKSVSHMERLFIGQQLAKLDDFRDGVGVKDGLPDIVWIKIPGGEVKLEGDELVSILSPFYIAKYPVTNMQFEAFVSAEDGYRNQEWWRGIDVNKHVCKPSWQEANCPRESIAQHQAIVFCRWLSAKLGFSIRLPTEWEWQQAATGGEQGREYPWEGEWDADRCNSRESGLKRTTAVGMYPCGVTQQGVLDMAGNISEWCLNIDHELEKPSTIFYGRVRRGGSWYDEQETLHLSNRNRLHAVYVSDRIGFRLVRDIEL